MAKRVRGASAGWWQGTMCHQPGHIPTAPAHVLRRHRVVAGARCGGWEGKLRQGVGGSRVRGPEQQSFTFTAYSLLVMRLTQDWTLAWAPSPSTSSCSW